MRITLLLMDWKDIYVVLEIVAVLTIMHTLVSLLLLRTVLINMKMIVLDYPGSRHYPLIYHSKNSIKIIYVNSFI